MLNIKTLVLAIALPIAGQIIFAQQSSPNNTFQSPTKLSSAEKPQQETERLFTEGTALAEQNKFSEAIPLLERASALSPDQIPILINLGFAYSACSQPDKAFAALQKAIALSPSNPDALQASATVYDDNGHIDEAIKYYQQYLQTTEKLPANEISFPREEALTNLGLAYSKQQRMVDAINALQSALKINPKLRGATINLASCYVVLGKFEDAITYYEKYLVNYPDAADRKEVSALVVSLKERGGKDNDPNSSDYFDSEKAAGLGKWPSASFPLKVFIEDSSTVPSYRPSFKTDFLKAFDTWASATGGIVTYIVTSNPKDANISCKWVNDRTSLIDINEAGQCITSVTDGLIEHAKISLLTLSPEERSTLSDDSMIKVCLHEIGHALGLLAHSTNTHDCMYYVPSSPLIGLKPTDRDIATLKRLYEGYLPAQK